MISWLEKNVNRITEYWNKKKYWQAILLVASYILLVVLLFFIGYQVLGFVIINFEALVTIVFLYVFLFFAVREYFADKRLAREQQEKELQAMREAIDQKALEANYSIIRKILFRVLKNNADICALKPPVSEKDIDSPNHYLNQGTFYLYQYVAFKKATVLENDIIKSVLQDEINRLLANGHVDGLGNQTVYLFEGRACNYVDLYQITESAGYITISVAIASEDYYRFKTAQDCNRLLIVTNSTGKSHDKDF